MLIAQLGTSVYGLMSLAIAIVELASKFGLLGLNAAVERFVAFYFGENDRAKIKGVIYNVLKITILTSVIITFTFFSFSDFIAVNLFNKPELARIIQIFSIGIPAVVLTEVLISSFKAMHKVEYGTASKDFLDSVYKIILAAIPAYFGYGILGLSVGYVIALFLTMFTAIYFLEKKVFSVFTSNTKSVFEKMEIVKYAFPVFFGSIISTLLKGTDTILLGFFETSEKIGIYNAASPTATLLMLVPTAILSLFLPIITSQYAKDGIEKVKETYFTISKWVLLTSLPLFMGMVIFADNIIVILFGVEYKLAVLPLIILSFGYFVFSIIWTSASILSMLKKTKQMFLASFIGILVNIFLNYFLIPMYGITGAAIATSTALCVYSFILFVMCYSKIKVFPFKFKTLLFSVLSFFGYFILFYFVGTVSLYVKLFVFFVISVFYLIGILKFAQIDVLEINLLELTLEKIGVKLNISNILKIKV